MADNIASNRLVSKSKRLIIDISREEKKNEPNLTLGHLTKLSQSITDSFGSTGKIIVPDVYSLKILDGENNDIHIKGSALDFKVDFKSAEEKTGEILGKFYPDDVISILLSIKSFIEKEYGAKGKRKFTWGYDLRSILLQLRRAGTDISVISSISMGDLRNAAIEISGTISELYKEIAEKTELDLDPVQPLLDKIEKRFKEKAFADRYRKIWEELGENIAKTLANSSVDEKVIVADNYTLSIGDTKKVFNAFYEQITLQYKNKKPAEIEPPWNRITPDKLKDYFDISQGFYFSLNEVSAEAVVGYDSTKAKNFIEKIELFFEELEKEPEKKTAGVEAADDEDGGGGETEEEPEKPQALLLTAAEIESKIIKELEKTLVSGELFTEYFKKTLEGLDQKQRDWLLANLPIEIKNAFAEDKDRTIENGIDEIIAGLTIDEETNSYPISTDQLSKFTSKLSVLFFEKNKERFNNWILSVKSVTAIDEEKVVKPAIPKKTAVVPGEIKTGDVAADVTPQGLDIARGKKILNLTNQFLGIRFGEGEGEFLREEVYKQIDIYLKSHPEDAKNIGKVFQHLELTNEIYQLAQTHYRQELAKLANINNEVDLANIYYAIDSVLVLIEDPHEYLNNLTDEQLISMLGLADKNVDVKKLRKVALGLIFVRRAHYFINHGTKIIPWLKKDKHDQATQKFSGAKNLLIKIDNKAGDDVGVIALNSDGSELTQSKITEEQKRIVKEIYQKLWVQTVAGKTEDQLFDIYEYYGINIINIDFNEPPPGFIYSQMAQGANLPTSLPHESKESGLAKAGKQFLGRAALNVVAPEVAAALAALEAIPFFGEKAKEITDKTGQTLVEFGVILAAGATALIGYITQSLPLLFGGILGGIGLLVGGPLWGAVGATAGYVIGSKVAAGSSASGVGGLLKKLGGGKGGAGNAFKLAKPVATIPSIAAPAIGVVGTTAAGLGAAIIGGGTQLYPVAVGPDSYPNAELNISKYVDVTKTTDISKLELNQKETITYTITITPKDAYIIDIDLEKTKDEWTYIGGDSLNLKDKTPEIIKQIKESTNEEPFSEAISPITYEVEMSSKNDVAINNTFTLFFDVVDESGAVVATDDASAFTTVIIGEPEIGCLQPGPAGVTEEGWNRTSLEWNSNDWGRIMKLYTNHAGKSALANSLICKGGPVTIYRFESNGHYGGWYLGPNPNPRIALYNWALTFSDAELEYTLIHELGHVTDNVNPLGDQRYKLYLDWGKKTDCFGYPVDGKCDEYESFSEAFSLYVARPGNHKDLSSYSSEAYKYFMENIFNGEEFK